MNSAEFRKELTKVMPGYNWTIHKENKAASVRTGISCLVATGIQSSGFNRLSTLSVSRREKDGVVRYEARSAAYGTKSPWAHIHEDGTLARALRGLQDHYEANARHYNSLASALRQGRVAAQEADPT